MGYTDLFEEIRYNDVKIRNIFKQINIDVDYLESKNAFTYYNIKDGEKPEDVARSYYNESQLYWLVLKLNNMRDYFYDWPLTRRELDSYVDSYYEEQSDLIQSQLANSDTGVSEADIKEQIYEALYNENESKRKIRVLKLEYLEPILEEINANL